jgi:hypothetical protein
MKIGIRFHVLSVRMGPGPVFNEDPICRGKTQIDFTGKIADRVYIGNRSLIFPERFLIGIVIAIVMGKPRIAFRNKKPRKTAGIATTV